MRIDVHVHSDQRLEALLARMEMKLSKELDDLKAQVAQTTTIAQSAVTLIGGIADRITAAGTDKAALTALTDELRADDDSLAAAVAANTPAAEPA